MKKENEFEKRFNECLEKEMLNQKNFILTLLTMLNGKNASLDDYEKSKSLYSRKIKGERDFKLKEVAYTEEILHTTFSYLVNGTTTKPVFTEKGIKYLAYLNDYQKYLEADNTEYNVYEENSILFARDEYDKSALQYIVEYDAFNGLKYLINEHGLHYQLNYSDGNLAFDDRSIADDLSKEALLMILRNDDKDAFEKFFDWRVLLLREHNKNIFEDEEVLKNILTTKKIYKSMLGGKKFVNEYFYQRHPQIKKIESKCINPLLNKLVEFAFKNEELYTIQLKEILKSCLEFNEESIEYLFNQNIKGLRLFGDGDVGIFERDPIYRLFKLKNIPSCNDVELGQMVLKLDAQTKDIDFSNSSTNYLQNMYFNSARRLNDNYLFISSNNQDEYDALDLLNSKGYVKAPKLTRNIIDGYDGFSLLPGIGEYMPYATVKTSIIISLVKELKAMNNIFKKNLGSNKVYCHRNLKPSNVLLQNDEITGIISWSKCEIGNEWDDFLDVFLLWGNCEMGFAFDNDAFDLLINMLKAYEPSDEFIKNFGDKMIARIQQLIDSLPHDAEYALNFKTYGIKELWIKFNLDKLNNIKDYLAS